MGIDKKVIDEIVSRVTAAVPATRIIVFGTAATGEMTPDSDIDLLILERELPDPRAERLRVRIALQDIDYPFDIIMMSEQRFEETKNIIGGIAYPAHRKGRLIYQAAGFSF